MIKAIVSILGLFAAIWGVALLGAAWLYSSEFPDEGWLRLAATGCLLLVLALASVPVWIDSAEV